MKGTVYIETSVVSYLVADQSSNIRTAGHQLATKECWSSLKNYKCFISDTFVEEASRGNVDQSQKRLHAVKLFEVLKKISQVIVDSGWAMPVICSPEEFLEAENE